MELNRLVIEHIGRKPMCYMCQHDCQTESELGKAYAVKLAYLDNQITEEHNKHIKMAMKTREWKNYLHYRDVAFRELVFTHYAVQKENEQLRRVRKMEPVRASTRASTAAVLNQT